MCGQKSNDGGGETRRSTYTVMLMEGESSVCVRVCVGDCCLPTGVSPERGQRWPHSKPGAGGEEESLREEGPGAYHNR